MNDNTNKKQLFWSRKMIEKFIQIYKENECLYDLNHVNYNNKLIKSEALKNILQKMQQYLPNLDLHDVQEKIKAIRSQYATEISLIEEAEAMGNNYVSNLWCFEQLEFLRKHIAVTKADGQPINEETSFNNEHIEDNEDANSDDSEISLYTESNSLPRTKRPYSRKFRWSREELQIFIKTLKKYPILYNPNHKDYSNRDLRCLERNKVLHEMKKVDHEIRLNDIRDKMRCLRKQFMKEVRLLKKAHANNVTYVPKLWCFQNLADLYRYEINITGFYTEHIKHSKEDTNLTEQQSDNEDSDYTEYEQIKSKKAHSWNREETGTFIKWLKQHPLLYNPKHKDYTNNSLRKLEHIKLLKKVKLLNHKITINDMRKKIHTLRSQYVREVGSLRKAYENNDIYIPKLWCFDSLANMYQDDLKKFYNNKETKNNENDTTFDYEEDYEMEKESITPKKVLQDNMVDEETNFNDNDEVDMFSEDSEMFVEDKTTSKREYQWDRDNLKLFINMINQHPMLYDTQHKDYGNFALRKIEYHKLLQEVRRLDSKINMEVIRKKVRSLRNQYVREVRSLKRAYEKNESYIPKLWCFDRLCKLYKEDLTPFYKNMDKHNENSMSSISSEYSLELEEISEIFNANDGNEIENVSKLADVETNLENPCINTIIEETLENPIHVQNTNIKNNSTQSSADVDSATNYEWLGDLVVTQLQEIAPNFHTEFAWDVQCLMRNYILKTKTDRNELVSTSKSSTSANDVGKSSNTSHDLILPKTSNISLNISFV